MSHFQIPQDFSSAQNNTMVQDSTNRLIIANREKIIIFDGENWSKVTTPSAPVALHFDSKNNTVYVGCLHHFGYLNVEDSIAPYFSSLSDKFNIKTKSIDQIESTDQEVVFMSKDQLYIYDKKAKVDSLILEDGKSFTQIIQNQNQIILSTSDGALSLLKEKKLNQVAHFPHNRSVVSHFSDSKSLIIVNDAGEIYYFNGKKYVRIWLKKAYLKNHMIIGILRLKNNKLLIATKDQGAIVINRNTGQIETNIDYASGLPDDHLHFMYHDRKGNAWFGHDYGLTKLDINIPFEDFSSLDGLQGHIQDVTYFKNRLYVATSVGLFHLVEKEDYAIVEESSVLNAKKKKKPTPGRRKRRKKITKDENAPKKILLSVKRVFEKDLEIQSSCLDLQIINSELIAVTEKGVFDLNTSKTKKIFDEDIAFVTYDLTESDKKVIILNKNNSFITLSTNRKNQWSFTRHKGEGLSFAPTYLYHYKADEYWVASNKKAARFSLEQDTIYNYQEYNIENPFAEPMWVQRYEKDLVLFTNSKAYRFDYDNNQFQIEDSITQEMQISERVIHSQKGITWFKHDNRWKNLSHVETHSKKFRFISIVHDIKNIFFDLSQPNYWIVDKYDHLIYFSALKKLRMDSNFGIYLSHIENKAGERLNTENLELDHEHTSLKLTYYTPFYLPSYEVLYRFKVDGLEDAWSEWSEENILNLTGLRPNDYAVHVQAKTLFNDGIDSSTFTFKITPPYWHTSWFYTLEIMFFVGLLLVSFSASKSRSKQKRVIIFRKAMIFMTFIIFVEYFEIVGQTLFDIGDSPVVSFVIQVILAIAVFPLERLISLKMNIRQGI